MSPDEVVRAVLLDERDPADRAELDRLRARPGVQVLDHRDAQRAELARVVPTPSAAELDDPGRLAWYPWRSTLVGVLGPAAFRTLRLDRNRNKVTREEQDRLAGLTIGVVGLSVGHAVAHTLALEGLCGALRLADFDTLELSNLNRIPATVLDLGLGKAVVAARRIAELDPYLAVTLHPDGLDAGSVDGFCDGLDVLVEECDSLDVKLLVREAARSRGVPVLMETSDRGLLDVERFDLEPDRPLFHGLLGDVDAATLAGLSTQDKVPHVMRILDAVALSDRMAASMVEVGRSLTTWPQLGGDVALGGAVLAAAVRRLGLGLPLASGRLRVDLDERLAGIESPTLPAPAPDPVEQEPRADAATRVGAVLEAVRRAPSGGNAQPWSVVADADGVHLHLDPAATTAMDVAHRGSHVALGAALHNARVAAAGTGSDDTVVLFPDPDRPHLVATLPLRPGAAPGRDDERRHRAVLARGTDRGHGDASPLGPTAREALTAAAAQDGATLHLLEDRADLRAAGELLAASDRVRYLTADLHREMVGELAWPGRDDLDAGIDVRTLGLAEADLTKLAIAARPEVVALLSQWDRGEALGDDTRDRVASGSALAVVTVAGTTARDYLRGGAAVEAVWVCAQEHGLGVQPHSPVFLYALDDADRAGLAPDRADELGDLQARFRALVGLAPDETVALVLRLSRTAAAPVRSRRRVPVGASPGSRVPGPYPEPRDRHPG